MDPLVKALHDLERIKNVSGRNAKLDILKEADSLEFRYLLNVTLNPYLTLGARVPEQIPRPWTMQFKEMKALITQLSTRRITGGAAQNNLAEMVAGVPLKLQPLFRDVLNKEPRIGVDVKSVNAVWKHFIPEFSPQLANDSKKRKFPLFAVAEPKFDGLRALLCVTDEKAYILSRKGLPLYNADMVIEEALRLKLPNGVYDGELFGETFHQSVGTAHRSVSLPTEVLHFHVFDQLTWEEWKAKKCVVTFAERRIILEEIVKAAPFVYIKLVEQQKVSNLEEALAWAKQWKTQGLEGAVVKDLEAPYLFKRTDAWLKVKFTKTYDVVVNRVGPGHGKFTKTLGHLFCTYKKKEVRVGGGLSDALRDEWWKHPERIVGKTIEVEADADETHKGSLRFLRFIRIREDK